MAEVRHITTRRGEKKVEIFVDAAELAKTLRYQDPKAFDGVILNLTEYCLTFKEE